MIKNLPEFSAQRRFGRLFRERQSTGVATDLAGSELDDGRPEGFVT